MEKIDILEQLSKEALLVLEKKAFATEHRGQYLLEKQKKIKTPSLIAQDKRRDPVTLDQFPGGSHRAPSDSNVWEIYQGGLQTSK